MKEWKDWDPKELERYISPIRWSPVKNKQEAIDNHIAAAMKETSLAKKEVPCKLDVPYGVTDQERFDIYGSNLSNTSPVFIWVHGGFWLTGDKDWSGFFIRNIYSRGFKSIIIGYPLGQDAKVREMCNAIHNAVEKAMSLFPQAQFVIAGHSAGAHLVANILFGNTRIGSNQGLLDRILGFALLSGIYDIRPVQLTAINDALDLSPQEVQDLSPLLNGDKIQAGWSRKQTTLKILVGVGEFDPPEFKRQAQELTNILRDKGLKGTNFWSSDKDDHFTIIENFSKRGSVSSIMLKEFLKTTTAEANYKKSNL